MPALPCHQAGRSRERNQDAWCPAWSADLYTARRRCHWTRAHPVRRELLAAAGLVGRPHQCRVARPQIAKDEPTNLRCSAGIDPGHGGRTRR